MGSIRFRKQIKLVPGVKLNVNKQSVGLTGGVRGAHMTVNSKGQRTMSAGIPGTGLSYRDTRAMGSPTPTQFTWTARVGGTLIKGDSATVDYALEERGYDGKPVVEWVDRKRCCIRVPHGNSDIADAVVTGTRKPAAWSNGSVALVWTMGMLTLFPLMFLLVIFISCGQR